MGETLKVLQGQHGRPERRAWCSVVMTDRRGVIGGVGIENPLHMPGGAAHVGCQHRLGAPQDQHHDEDQKSLPRHRPPCAQRPFLLVVSSDALVREESWTYSQQYALQEGKA